MLETETACVKAANSDPLLKKLRSIIEQQEELLHKQNLTEDWHVVAVVVDRLV